MQAHGLETKAVVHAVRLIKILVARLLHTKALHNTDALEALGGYARDVGDVDLPLDDHAPEPARDAVDPGEYDRQEEHAYERKLPPAGESHSEENYYCQRLDEYALGALHQRLLYEDGVV